MSTTIDERVVKATFDNNQFERAVAKTMSTLEGLKKSLNLEGAAKGISDVNAAANRFSLGNIAAGVEGISAKFQAMGIIGVTALANIATRAIQAGAQLAKSLTITPITDGLKEYETNLNSVQTILANTQVSGATLNDVNKALQDLNHYSDQTIYNFSQMAKNIGTFTAAGVDLNTATASIKGIANLAAFSGSNAEQASNAMYQLSQEIAAGKVTLMGWNSVVNAGMGGTTFQRALATTAVAMGKIDEKSVKLTGSMKNVTIGGESFRDSISSAGGKASWLTSDVLTSTLKQFTGDMKDSELATLGFTAAQIKSIQATAKTAKNAATEVKTLSGLMDTTKEAIVSGWSETWQLVFGDFEEAKKTFTNLSQTIGKFVGASSDARNKVLKDWKTMGGRTVLISGIQEAFKSLMGIVQPIKDAFREIFPPTTGKRLMEMTTNFRSLMLSLRPGPETMNNIKRTFKGVFALFDIGFTIVKKIGQVFVDLFRTAGGGEGHFLSFTATIGDFLVRLRDAIKTGEGFTTFFRILTKVLGFPIQAIKTLIGLFADGLTGGMSTAEGAIKTLQKRFAPFSDLGETIARVWGTVKDKLGDIFTFFGPFGQKVSEAFAQLWDSVQNAFSTGNFNGILDAVNTGLLGGLVLLFRKFVNNGLSLDFGGGMLSNLSGILDGLNGSLQALQKNIQADTMLKIAAAIGILAISVVALSLIDSAALTKALAAITVMFIQLAGALALFEKATSTGGVLKLPVLAAGLILLSTAIGILAISVALLAQLDWNELAKGLTGVVVLIAALAGSTQLMAKDAPKMIITGIGLIAVATAIKILASAVKDFAAMDWNSMAKGLAGVGAALGALALFTRLAKLDKMGVASGVGLLLLAASLKIIASAVQDFGGMDWVVLGKGFASMAVSLGLIAAAIALLPKSMILQAAGLAVVAGSLVVLAQALKTMGGMSWEEIAKGLVVLAGGLTVIAIAMGFMTTAIFGASALLVVAASLAILTPVLMALGGMSWGEIGKGLAMLAGVFVVLGLAGLALTPVVPTLIGLGIAIALLGVGVALAGVGLLAFSAGLTALAISGAAGAAALTAIAAAIIGLIPMALKAVGEGLVLLAGVIAGAGPQFTAAMTTLMLALLGAINKVAPVAIKTIVDLVYRLLTTIANNIDRFVTAGTNIIVGLLNGITKNIPKIAKAGADAIIALIKSIGEQQLRIIKAGLDTILKFLDGLSQAIRDNGPKFGKAGADMLAAIVQGLVGGVGAFSGTLWDAAQRIGSSFLSGIKSFFGIASPSKLMYKMGQFVMVGFRKGLDGNATQIQAAFDNLKKMLSDSLQTLSGTVTSLEAKLKKLRSARNKDVDAINATKAALAQAKKEYSATGAALTELTKNWTDDKNKLGNLANQYDVLAGKIKAANDKLADAKKTRDDYAKSVKDQYADLPDIGADDTASSFANDLRKQIADTQAFASALQQLRKQGLNDTLYKELLAKGPGAMPFIQDLLSTGSTGIKQLNELSSQLDSVAGTLGTTAGNALYQAAVDSAAGLVKGLQNQQAAIEIQMDKIADAMVAAIKRKLGIKSPSREFMKIGKWSNEGLAKGLSQYRGVVERSSEDVGHAAIESMRKSISGLSDIVDGNLDLRPVITPVLDLTGVQKDAGKLEEMVKVPAITVGSAYKSARGAQAAIHANENAFESEGVPFQGVVKQTTFIQNNTSPKALSDAEIYRQTKSLISQTKEGVNS